jgi:uncharacterized membrane protein
MAIGPDIAVSGDVKAQAGNPPTGDARVTHNIRTISQLEHMAARRRSAFVQACNRVTVGIGTPASVVVHALWFGIWIAWNAHLLGVPPFDPFPFQLLTSIVSLEVIFLTLFVLASQNQMTRDADQRAQLALQVNLLSEQEMTLMLRMLRDVSAHLGLKTVAESDTLNELTSDTDIADVAERLEKSVTESRAKRQ